MNEFIRPCEFNRCATSEDEQAKNFLCTGIAEAIINAGGAGVFEATPCSLEALHIITYAEGERGAELRQKLGIVGVMHIEDTF